MIARPEPRHQPPADAVRARARQEERRPDRRGQPAARGGAGEVQEPADPARLGRRRHSAGRPAPPDPAQRRPRAVPGARRAAAGLGRRRPRLHRQPHDRVRGVGGPRRRGRLGRRRTGDGPGPQARSRRPRRCCATPGRRSSAGRWASPSTATRSPRSRSSSTSRCCRATSASPARGCARSAATPTSRATARWGSGSGRSRRSSTRSSGEFGFDPPREPGFDTVEAVRALRDGRARVFFAMGGNFVSAVSDTDVTEDAMRRADLTVHVSTKLNRSHVVTGREALILPALGRSERDRTGGREQRVTVEDSMSAVHASKGPLKPASKHLRSEVDIVCSLAEATLGDAPRAAVGRLPGRLRRHPAVDRQRRARAARRTTRRSTSPAGSCCRTRRGTRASSPPTAGRAMFSVSPIDVLDVPGGPAAAADAALARPVQHHDLRPRRPLPGGQGRAAGRVRAPRRHRPTSGSPTATWSTW